MAIRDEKFGPRVEDVTHGGNRGSSTSAFQADSVVVQDVSLSRADFVLLNYVSLSRLTRVFK